MMNSLSVDRAIASGDCHIVDVNWLVKSIEKRTPEDVQQYMLLQGKKPVDVINLKCKKRACGTDPDDEDTGLSKKFKDEEKIRFAKLAALVDSHREGSQCSLFFPCLSVLVLGLSMN
jgi:poly [ADP-ribose] polymerase